MPTLADAHRTLAGVRQEHVLAHVDSLDPPSLAALLRQIDSIHWDEIPALVDQHIRSRPRFEPPATLEPAPYYPLDPGSPTRRWDAAAARARGESLIAAGRVACFTVAGGQGTRLGFDGPKGCYPGGAVTAKPLFQIFAEGVLAWGRKFGVTIPWYIMTSPQNHDATVAFFHAHAFFGLSPEQVMHFQQGVMPSFDLATGRILMTSRAEIATNPDGHGGSIRALVRSGATADMRRRGVEHLSYFQVDNPLTRVLDPVFLGLHAGADDSSGEMSSKMLPKVAPDEKVGVFCLADGRLGMIEYSDLPPDLARQTGPDGRLRFNAGNPALHALSVEFIERLEQNPDFALPFHRAEKKVPCIDPRTGERIEPTQPNAVKLERFVFDALPLARSSIVLEADRVEEFGPIKNATGTDSAESSARLQTLKAARWLRAARVDVPSNQAGEPDCTLEISPLTAVEPAEFAKARLPDRIERGAKVAL